MFFFRKSALPKSWPSTLHNKCNNTTCLFPNAPQPVSGIYSCRACKGSYRVSQKVAEIVDRRYQDDLRRQAELKRQNLHRQEIEIVREKERAPQGQARSAPEWRNAQMKTQCRRHQAAATMPPPLLRNDAQRRRLPPLVTSAPLQFRPDGVKRHQPQQRLPIDVTDHDYLTRDGRVLWCNGEFDQRGNFTYDGRAECSAIPPPDMKYVPITQIPEGRDVEVAAWSSESSGRSTTNIPDRNVAIAVMGATGSGKTSFINLVSGSSLRVGRGLQSCTNAVQVANPFELDGRQITLIDTPGFDDTTKSDADILRMIAAFLVTAYQSGKKLAGVIYLHRISDVRMGGISTRNFKMFRELCGESTLKNVVIVTNMWSEVSLEVGEAREAELAGQDMFFKPVLEKGAQLLRHENTLASGHAILQYLIRNNPLPLRIQEEMVDRGMDISQTAAGEELNRELMIQIRKHREEMRILQEEMKEAIRTKDEETKRELEAETKKLQAEMSRVQNDAEKLASDYNEEKAKLERQVHEVSERTRQEAEKAAAEHQRQMGELQERLQQSTGASAAEREHILWQLNEMKQRYEEATRARGGFFGNLGRAIDRVFGM